MQFHKFPESVAPYVQRLEDQYRANITAKGHVERGTDWPAYRLPSGIVRLVYDPYRPDYPDGATPGLADCSFSKLHGPAGHMDGYDAHPFNFRPL